ncbi:copper homeostasis protein CutC [Streptococcus danieliae]|uniref:PF03932 family protein CutC n=1 Tax=Streptococcus danieliae TaxID=747656 RepID=A0A7X3G9C4_9STRE|nr:copper homeostasis protein CutC [Streptococcus danieliae]MVX59523.1 copper homeostasis protein CutC [Streptococcus danieliae]
MLYEFCAESLEALPRALAAGAGRVELCDDLSVGGLTPGPAMIQEALTLGLPLVLMIRPRAGNFVYSGAEVELMVAQIKQAKEMGVSSFVFGVLLEDGSLDQENLYRLLAEVGDGEAVFHMAFDQIPWEQRLEALDWLAQAGFQRILTHGGPLEQDLYTYADYLDRIIARAAGKIDIILGGGITLDNRDQIAQRFGVTQLHGTRIVG